MGLGYSQLPDADVPDLLAPDPEARRATVAGPAIAAVPSVQPSSPPLRQLLIAGDMAVVTLGWLATLVVLSLLAVDVTLLESASRGLLVVGAAPFLLSASGLYRRRVCAVRSAEIARLGRTSALLAAVTLLLWVGDDFRAAVLGAGVGSLVWFGLFTAERGVFREWIQGRRATGDFGAPVVVVGGDAASIGRTVEFLSDNPVLGFDVQGFIGPASLAFDTPRYPWLGTMADVAEIDRLWEASGVVLDANSLTGEELNDAVQRFSAENLHVHVSSGLRGIDRRRITLSPLADETFLHVAPVALSRPQVVAKRVVDVALGGLLLLLLSPVLLISALVTWAYGRGPVLYRQERVGLEGERFTLYKLRTMIQDADRKLEDLRDQNGRSGPLFKLARDPRVTPFGRFLRATSIDEIPQLFNVLEGTMSLVGPRPALATEVAQFDDRLHARLTVKPGMTGLWQVEARDLPSFDLYRRFDLMYVQNWSLSLDLAIIARTVTVVLLRGVKVLLPARLRRVTALD
jgi:exopolysaccharide biosynthesis polyprenyl glycosylphosphotransferase